MSAVLPVLTARPSWWAALLLALLSWLPALAGPADAAEPYRLSAAEGRVVLRLVDDLCADTWCEGDHAIRFRRFSCSPSRGCLLSAQVAPWSAEPLQWQARSAPVVGFRRFCSMVATAPDGTRSLRPAFLEAVGEAGRAMTASVPVDAVRPAAP